MGVAFYRKKPVTIEAAQLKPDNVTEILDWIHRNDGEGIVRGGPGGGSVGGTILIHTLEGDMWAEQDDWVIRGVKGEFYPCKPDIFAATYNPDPGA